MFKRLFIVILLVAISACESDRCQNCVVNNNGGGIYGTGDGTDNAAVPERGQVLLGPVIGATITVQQFFDETESVLCTVKTNEDLSLELGGTFNIPSNCIENNEALYLISAEGGFDIDVEDDGILDLEPTPLERPVYALITGSMLYQVEGWKVNHLTSRFYTFAKYGRDEMSLTEEQIAKAMTAYSLDALVDNGEGGLANYEDILTWNPRIDYGSVRIDAVKDPEKFYRYALPIVNLVVNGELNDTGVRLCADYAFSADNSGSHSSVSCEDYFVSQGSPGLDAENDLIPAGQDAVYGRDSEGYSSLDGDLGFSFIKIDHAGQVLDANAEEWQCVADNTTGLMWEIKTNDGGLQDKNHVYTWYNDISINNNRNAGVEDTGPGVGSDACFDESECDTKQFINSINTMNSSQGLCSHSDWRLPSRSELLSIVHFGEQNPAIDSSFFPHTSDAAPNFYWTSSQSHYNIGVVFSILFSSGQVNITYKNNSNHIRLVRTMSNEEEVSE